MKSPETTDDTAIRLRLQSEATPRNPEEQQHVQQWLGESATHREAYLTTDTFLQAIDGLSQAELDQLGEEAHAESTQTGPTDWLKRVAVAAVLACIIIGGWWYAGQTAPEFATATGELRTITLADGSIVELNTGTALDVEFSQTRRVSLMHGEAFFQVAPDAARPLEVAVGSAQVRALGTAFNVRTDGDSATISVQEHAVEVISPTQKGQQTLTAGQQVSLRSDGTIGPVQAYHENQLAWRRQRLIFVNRPLGEVIAELNRYRRGYIVPLDSGLRTLTVTANFDVRDPEKALRTIETVLPVRLFRMTDRLVLLFRTPLA